MTRTQAIIQQVGGLVMLVGAVLPLFVDDFSVAFYWFSAGAVAFAGIQFLQRYDGDDFRLRRLRRQQVAGALLHWQHIAPFRGDEWKVTLAIAAVLEVYTAFRMP